MCLGLNGREHINLMASPIRILFLIDKLVPAGTQTNLLKLIQGLDRKRFQPYVIALLEGGELAKEFQAAGVEPVILKTGALYSFSAWKTYRFLTGWMRSHAIDIVQTHFLHADILGALAAGKAGVSKIIMARRDEGFWRNGRQLALNRFFNRCADRMLCNSQAVARAVKQNEKVPESKIDVIYNGIESGVISDDLRGAARKELDLKKTEIAVGVVANLRHAIKGHIYILEAMAKVVKKCPKAKLFLIGDGPLRADLELYAKKLRITDAVNFLGSRRDIPALLNAVDIACLPSLTEGFSNSVLEYMTYGKPVVATAVGGNPEVVTEETGFLVEPRDAKALADKILKLAEDDKLRRDMGQAGRRRIEEAFSVQAMVQSYEKYYAGLVPGGDTGAEDAETVPARICHLIWALEPGGAERQVVTIAKWQKRHGHRPQVVCLTRKGTLAAELEERGIPVTLITKKAGADFSIIGKLAQFFKEHSIDLVHTHVPTANLWGRLAAKKAGCAAIVSEHSDMAATNFKFKWINRLLNGHTAGYLVVSQHIKDLMAAAGVPAEKIKVVRNGIPGSQALDDATRAAIRKALNVSPQEPLIGTVGRLEERKDHSMLLKACAQIKKEIPAARFMLVGDGPLRGALEKEAANLGLQNAVIFTGVRQDIPALLAALDIFVLSSVTEGISISLLEAMSAGKPCAVTQVGGNPEVVTDKVTGRLVPARDPKPLAAMVVELLNNPKRTVEMGAAAQLHVAAHFSQDSMMRGIQEAYETLGGLAPDPLRLDLLKNQKVYTLAHEKAVQKSV
jgi:glycosyltransferase involved in cell wall biosynthesis